MSHLESWEFFLHDLYRTYGHVQLVHKVLSEVAKLEVPVGSSGALGRLVTLHLHHHLEQSCLSRTVFSHYTQEGYENENSMIYGKLPMQILDSMVAERSTFEKMTLSVPG